LATATLAIAVPVVFLKLPWLPATVQSFVQTATESTANGTTGYIKDHGERLWRLVAALLFYIIGLWAIVGLSGIALGLRRCLAAQRIAWLSALIIGVGLPIFDSVRIAPSTDRSYVFLVIYLPIGIAVLSLFALVITCVSQRRTAAASSDERQPWP
jgi:hypothetical protein